MAPNYEAWSRTDLIARIAALEQREASNSTSTQPNTDFDFYSYPIRKIASQGVLFDALCRARLIDEARGYDGCGWEKCGRTDRGVSAASQVISLWMKMTTTWSDCSITPPTPLWPPKPEEEHDYPGILNRILPPTIRSSPARRSCTFRHLQVLFLRSELGPLPHARGRQSIFIPSKQLTLFMRRILRAEINAVEAGMFVFDLVGTAFLYHQVRNIMAVLLLVGRGLEPPDIITQLLNMSEGAEPGNWEVLSRKPEYQMADGLPLVLWDCRWQTGGAEGEIRGGQARGIYEHLEGIYERSRVFTTLNHHFLKKAAELHSSRPVVTRQATPFRLVPGTTRRVRQYVPLMRRVRNDEVEAINERWRNGKGKKHLAKVDNGDDDEGDGGDDDGDE
ncbi:pseudouridine synthase [Desarmillaria tabescens]|uniref:tRNA pseudouridine synthase n=1 Tax=Armillaria tabescens TaxID=1929756 RepID=A0AA39JJN4_ARMTA|nr:pseudouridine synthase [Desarmillaria tabescens]KAK0443888.1 pseudouridine synthase [Desarmillaria tabescens]